MPKDFFKNRDLLLQKKLTLTLSDDSRLERVATALNSATRRKILSLLTLNSYTIVEIAEQLNMSVSNISFHLKLLLKAGLINLTQNHSKRGNEKIVALEKHFIEILFVNDDKYFLAPTPVWNKEIPIGSFNVFDIEAPCGIADADGTLIGVEASPDIFYNYKRLKGEIVWFTSGYLEYHISNASIRGKVLESLQISCELCSECANYNNSFKSDISFWLNGKEVGTYTSPGDFGGRPGKYNPKSWPSTSTQYGMLVQLRIDGKGIWINQDCVNNELTIDDFAFITREKCLQFRLGVKKDAKYMGGLNLFGKSFGDYPQGIRFTAVFMDA